MKQEKPILHGRDHCPGGADPIPCLAGLIDPFGPFPDAVATLAATRNLLGYWRLGENSGTFADTSGQAQPADGTIDTETTALTRDVSGGLPADDDDGAVRFNDSDGTGSDFIATNSGGDGDRFNLDDSDMTIVAILQPIASASSFEGGVIGQLHLPGGGGLGGWALGVEWPLRQAWFLRSSAGSDQVQLFAPTLSVDAPTLVICTYSATNGHRIYYNGSVVASDPTTFINIGNPNLDPRIGRSGVGGGFLDQTFYGMVDEISVWGDEFSAEDIELLTGSFGQVTEGFLTITTVTAPYEVSTGDDVVVANGTGDVTLPTAAGIRGKEITVKNGGSGTITVEGFGTETIDGELSVDLDADEWITVVSDGENWIVVDETGTPTGGGNPADDTLVWMPLVSINGGVPEIVLDDDDGLIPTLIPI